MKKVFYSALLLACSGFVFTACNNGDYVANPSSAANSSVNPLNPLTADELAAYATGGSPSFIKATINGGPWSASGDTSVGWLLNSDGYNIVSGISGGKIITLELKNVYSVNVYNMGYNSYNTYGLYSGYDTLFHPTGVHYSYKGNSGEVEILENDALYIKGTFYFQSVDSLGDVVNINNGYFYIKKP